jgi:hypothetical protein
MASLTLKTVNNVLGILGYTPKTAVKWNVIDRVPCAVTMLKVSEAPVKFYDFDDYKRLVEAAGAINARTRIPSATFLSQLPCRLSRRTRSSPRWTHTP